MSISSNIRSSEDISGCVAEISSPLLQSFIPGTFVSEDEKCFYSSFFTEILNVSCVNKNKQSRKCYKNMFSKVFIYKTYQLDQSEYLWLIIYEFRNKNIQNLISS